MGSRHSSPGRGEDRYSINGTAPWEPGSRCLSFGGDLAQNGDRVHSIERLMTDRTRVHEAYIREPARTERLHGILATVLFICGCLVIVFAPEQREQTSLWMGAAMVVAAAGVAGYTRVWGKSTLAEFGADRARTQTGSGSA